MITNRSINRLLLLIRVPIECRGTMPSYCAHVATPKDAHAHGARARAVGWGVEAQHVQQVKSLYLTKYLAIFV